MEKEPYWSKYKVIFNKIVNRETITYGIAGILTTVVNFTTYHILCNIIGIPNLTSNAIAWVVAVTFAYIVNNNIVFLAYKKNSKEEAIKVTKFYGARLVSLGVEQLGMFVFVDLMGMYNLMVKAFIAIIVIIINYIFSKIYIFKK